MQDREGQGRATPSRVAEAGVPGLLESFEALALALERPEHAGDVVHDHRVVGAQGHGEARLAQRVLRASDVHVVGREQRPAARVLGHLLEVRFQHLDPPQHHVPELLALAERPERVLDRHVDVVVLAGGGDRGFGEVDDLLAFAGGEQRAPEQV